jgi:hypothetical protein
MDHGPAPHPIEHGFILLTFKPGRREERVKDGKLSDTRTSIPGTISFQGKTRDMAGIRIDSIDVPEDPVNDILLEVSTVFPLTFQGPGHYQIEALTDWLATARFKDDITAHRHWCCISDM